MYCGQTGVQKERVNREREREREGRKEGRKQQKEAERIKTEKEESVKENTNGALAWISLNASLHYMVMQVYVLQLASAMYWSSFSLSASLLCFKVPYLNG